MLTCGAEVPAGLWVAEVEPFIITTKNIAGCSKLLFRPVEEGEEQKEVWKKRLRTGDLDRFWPWKWSPGQGV